jgi:hypothetical protein
MASATSHLPKLMAEHGYLLASSTAIAFYGVFAGGFFVGGARGKAFGKEWAKKPEAVALMDEHKAAFDKEAVVPKFSENGYPDMGHGRYAATLPYKVSARAHARMLRRSAFARMLGVQARVCRHALWQR